MMYPSYKGTIHAHYPDLKTLPDKDRKRTIIMGTNTVPDEKMLIDDGFEGFAKRGQTIIIGDKIFQVF